MREAGLSRQKIAYLRDLAAHVDGGTLPLDEIESMTDDEVIKHLVQVKGIGRWTAQMFLMFRLGRPDVLPELDLGIQNAIQRAYRLRKRPLPERVRRIGSKWSPHSTIACWYLWRSLDNGGGQLGE
jgi:DNA-3-methyladenine glycosylase II